jgi:hypothetical protein
MPSPKYTTNYSADRVLSDVFDDAGKTLSVTGIAESIDLPTAPLSGQVSVTTSAAALPSVVLTVGAILTNTSTTATCYLGPTGVTTGTGAPLAPGASTSVAVSNLNTLYAIGSSALTLGYLGS